MVVMSSSVMANTRWYQVEVIVFFNNNEDAMATEQWPDLETLPDFRDAKSLFVAQPESSPDLTEEPLNELVTGEPLAFQSLLPQDLEMSEIYRLLTDLSAYSPVLHVGWRQPALDGSLAHRVYISDKPRSPANFNSTSIESMGHPIVERRVERSGLNRNSEPNYYLSDESTITHDGNSPRLDLIPDPMVEGEIQIRIGRVLYISTDFVKYNGVSPVRIKEQRQVKLREIHYFDHPLFGVLVQVTPYVIAEPTELPDENFTAE
jgi:hypothetical protein